MHVFILSKIVNLVYFNKQVEMLSGSYKKHKVVLYSKLIKKTIGNILIIYLEENRKPVTDVIMKAIQ